MSLGTQLQGILKFKATCVRQGVGNCGKRESILSIRHFDFLSLAHGAEHQNICWAAIVQPLTLTDMACSA